MAPPIGRTRPGYTPGSRFARFYGTNAQRHARQVKRAQQDLAASTGAAIFGASVMTATGQARLAIQKAGEVQMKRLANILV